LRLLAALHRRGIAHNDAAKEANWLCTPDGEAALVDFQVAMTSRRRGRVFRALAYEDLRHLLKHKRTYLPERLTARQRAVLARRGPLAMLWTLLVKPPYRFVTRVLLGWPERVGRRERQDGARRRERHPASAIMGVPFVPGSSRPTWISATSTT